MPKILRHVDDYVTNDLFPSIDPSHTQCYDVGFAHPPACPPKSIGMIKPFKVHTLPTTLALGYLARWYSILVTP